MKDLVAETPQRRDALGSLMRNFGFMVLYYGKGYSSRKHSGVNHNTFLKYFNHLAEDISNLLPEDRSVVSQRFLSWVVSTAISSSGDYLNEAFQAKSTTKEDRRAAIKQWIELLTPAIKLATSSTSESTLDPYVVTDALLALDGGEQVELFTASPRIGKQANSFTLYKHRYRILYLQRRLKKDGLTAQKANRLVQKASKTSVDTIRKWEKRVNEHLCVDTIKAVRAELKASIRSGNGRVSIDLIKERLDQIGEEYQNDRRKKKD